MNMMLTKGKSMRLKACKAAFPYTLPVLVGYLFIGIAFGVLLSGKGYSFWWAGVISLVTLAGAMQFVEAHLLALAFDPLSAVMLTLTVNIRHLFYGLPLLTTFARMGRFRPYLIFALSDENFSLQCSVTVPEGVDERYFRFYLSAFNHAYWVIGSLLGGLLGTLFHIAIPGLDFVMTALFIVILLNQWEKKVNRLPAAWGLLISLACLVLFGAVHFIIPALLIICLILTMVTWVRRRKEQMQ